MTFVCRLLLLAAVFWAPKAALADEDADDWQAKVGQVVEANARRSGEGDPLAAVLTICGGTACATTWDIRLDDSEARMVRQWFGPRPQNPEVERRAIARSIALLETLVGAKTGTWADHPRNQHLDWDNDEPGQMDCISEAANSKSYLERLQKAGLFVHHEVGGFVKRYLILLQHVAVEIVETGSDESYVVDSWEGANGEEPVIEPYLEWRMELTV